jgi:dihydroorotase
VSTRGSVAAVRGGRARGGRISAEAAPHHFLLTAGAAAGGDPNFKMNPPLRDEADRLAVLDGIADGTIEVVATDHAPHAAEKKARGVEAAPFGVVGLETLLPAVLTGLVDEARMPLGAALDRVLAGPARVLGASRPGLREGGPAELVVLDPAVSWTVRPEDLHSRSRNSAFLGRTLRGRVELVILGDRAIRP